PISQGCPHAGSARRRHRSRNRACAGQPCERAIVHAVRDRSRLESHPVSRGEKSRGVAQYHGVPWHGRAGRNPASVQPGGRERSRSPWRAVHGAGRLRSARGDRAVAEHATDRRRKTTDLALDAPVERTTHRESARAAAASAQTVSAVPQTGLRAGALNDNLSLAWQLACATPNESHSAPVEIFALA